MILGLVGKIASGKSLFAKVLSEFGFSVIELDDVARALDQPGSPYNQSIKRWFGAAFIKSNGHLERSLLRNEVFAEEKRLQKLNEIAQPLIRDSVNELFHRKRIAGETRFVLVGPILFQMELHHICQMVIQLRVKRETLLERITSRDSCARAMAENILHFQEKLFLDFPETTVVFENDFLTIEDYSSAVREFICKFLKEANKQ